jgi:hypothetical protein
MIMQNEEKIKKQNSLHSEINIDTGVTKTCFQCYKREFEKGKKAGEWEKTASTILYGKNAAHQMLIDGSGYIITDTDNHLQYFVDMQQVNKTDLQE